MISKQRQEQLAVRNASIAERYGAGESNTAIAKAFGISTVMVWKVLCKLGVERKARKPRKAMFFIVQARADGKTLAQIADYEGLTTSSIRERLAAIGVTQQNVRKIRLLSPTQLLHYQAALDGDFLAHDDALEIAREYGRVAA